MPLIAHMSDEYEQALTEVIDFATQECHPDVANGLWSVAGAFADTLVEDGLLTEDLAVIVGGELANFMVRGGYLADCCGQAWRNYQQHGDFF